MVGVKSDPVQSLAFVLFGEQSLLVQCADLLRQRGHLVAAIVTEEPRIARWAADAGIVVLPTFSARAQPRELGQFDYLLSITNLHLLPEWLLRAPRRGAINFHDGPATHNLGRNAPVWAIINGDVSHGVTWHLVNPNGDSGRVLLSREFPVTEDDNAFALNSQCYQGGLDTFPALLSLLETADIAGTADFDQRPYLLQDERPDGGALLDWRQPAERLARLVRALDFAHIPNPVLLPKLDTGSELILVRRAKVVAGNGEYGPGQIQSLDSDLCSIRCGEGALQILQATTLNGDPVDLSRRLTDAGLRPGSLLPAGPQQAISKVVAAAAAQELWIQYQLQSFEASDLPFRERSETGGARWQPLGNRNIAALLLLIARLNSQPQVAIAYMPGSMGSVDGPVRRHLAGPLPLIVSLDVHETSTTWNGKVGAELQRLEHAMGVIADLPARAPASRVQLEAVARSPLRVVRWHQLPTEVEASVGPALVVHVDDSGACVAQFDERQLSAMALSRLADCWATLELAMRDEAAPCRSLGVLSAEDTRVLGALDRRSPAASEERVRVHEQFEARVHDCPDHRACTFEGQSLSYRELNTAANRLARRLRLLGVGQGALVGVHVPRCLEMLVAMLAIHKAGAAYLPLDPTYPADRLAYMASDAGVSVVVSRSDVPFSLDVPHNLKLDLLADELAALEEGNLDLPGDSSDLAYVMYTSGSTGKPKGVMVEHRNVVNFFAGIDERMGTEPGVWLAITSISFDISVLELFWTLTRGFTVVLHGDALRQKGRAPKPATPPVSTGTARQPMSFGFFYWNVANGESDSAPDKYRLLLESARFADQHGFASVWTPERHFESFGGLYPNPSVTSAALATITSRVQLRAGSCVVPLHSPIRIAEEWSVVDNLSNGRAGISIASGWAAPDFVIKPESFADSKNIMFESLEIIRRLWRGETVEFPGPKGNVAVRTLPRPIQKDLPVWVTTAGNIDTFIQAGKVGANLLTHLLSQTVEETAVKIAAYRRAWAEAGHAGRGVVSLMLHTFVGPDRDTVEAIVRQPLKDYLKSAVALLKAAAWQSPTFKKFSAAEGKSLDDFFATVSDEDMDQLLEFAFQRYFHASGLFGSPQDCLEMVGKTAAADVDEIACLIDFGIDVDKVLAHLPYLDQLREKAQSGIAGDYSIASLLLSEGVTHFQCTPTMASLLASDADAHPGLAALRQMMVGGEALAPDLAQTLTSTVKGRVSNMYGPTETTIWSTSAWLDNEPLTPAGSVTIGSPLRNQAVHVLDDFQQLLPPGLPGELVIGGLGVTRGYWQRPELTAEKFLPDLTPGASPGARMYRTGDLGRWLPDGRLEFLGRRDQQVKIHGYRIELGEIEALLREDPQVAEAVVILREDTPGDKRLVGYVQPVRNTKVDPAALRLRLVDALPDFMVPSVILALSSLPQTPNGKTDRKALPAPPRPSSTGGANQAVAAPQEHSNREAMVADIWRRVLGLNEIGVRDNFFDIGGHSLLIIQVLKELREKVPQPIQMTDLFRHTTIETLARFLDGGAAAPDLASQRGRSRAEARRSANTRSP